MGNRPSGGLDAIMLAPTRELVANSTIAPAPTGSTTPQPRSEVRLADGNPASVGDLVITRTNDRRLRLTATDWVKNGDRWTIIRVGRRGDLTVRHNRSQLTVRLPADYVRTSTGLGYATTIHSAQGVSADTMHGLVTGQESRQQLYTMLTRGRNANHLYLQVVGDGDPHSLIRPDTIHRARRPRRCSRSSPATKRPSLPAPCCASSTTQRSGFSRRSSATPTASTSQPNSSSDPRPSQSSTKPTSTFPDSPPNRPGQPSEPTCWPLRPKLEQHPLRHLLTAASGRDLQTAGDMAAVLYWRLPALTPTDPGPLPWLQGIPATLHAHPVWGGYLAKRSQLVADLADQVQDHLCQGDGPPAWAAAGGHPTALVREIAVWRAANGINPHDPRPTGGGGGQLDTAAALWKQRLDWHIARSTDSSGNETFNERQAAHTAVSRSHHDSRRPYQTPGQRPNGPAAPGR